MFRGQIIALYPRPQRYLKMEVMFSSPLKVLLISHYPNIQVCFETLGELLDTNFIKILNKFDFSNEYGIANIVVLRERRGAQ